MAQDEWLDILFHIGWSTGDDGYAEAWINGHSLTGAEPVKGRTMYYAVSGTELLELFICTLEHDGFMNAVASTAVHGLSEAGNLPGPEQHVDGGAVP